MILDDGKIEIKINTISNKPLVEDLLISKFLCNEKEVKKGKVKVLDAYKIASELSAWGIPWRRTSWK